MSYRVVEKYSLACERKHVLSQRQYAPKAGYRLLALVLVIWVVIRSYVDRPTSPDSAAPTVVGTSKGCSQYFGQ